MITARPNPLGYVLHMESEISIDILSTILTYEIFSPQVNRIFFLSQFLPFCFKQNLRRKDSTEKQ